MEYGNGNGRESRGRRTLDETELAFFLRGCLRRRRGVGRLLGRFRGGRGRGRGQGWGIGFIDSVAGTSNFCC